MRAILCVLVALGASACTFDDQLFYGWDDRRVLCAESLDDYRGPLDLDRVLRHLDEAVATEQVLNLYTHSPGISIAPATLERVLDEIVRRDLPFVTYPELLDRRQPRAGVALGFDDDGVDTWLATRDTLDRHGARVTFFVTGYHAMSDAAKAGLRTLAADGHAIEAHSVEHVAAPEYVAEHGLEAYLRDQALPSIDRLIDDGYPVVAYAYPYGARDAALDQALLDHVALVRTTAGACPW